MRFKRGDHVVISERETTAADRKSSLFYPHFCGLSGVVDQIYEEEGEVCVEIAQESLPEAFRRRHEAIQELARRKWLNGLSEQERRSLPEEHKDLRLKYTVMVTPEDLLPEGRGKARKTAKAGEAAEPARLSEADISTAERQHMQELLSRSKEA